MSKTSTTTILQHRREVVKLLMLYLVVTALMGTLIWYAMTVAVTG